MAVSLRCLVVRREDTYQPCVIFAENIRYFLDGARPILQEEAELNSSFGKAAEGYQSLEEVVLRDDPLYVPLLVDYGRAGDLIAEEDSAASSMVKSAGIVTGWRVIMAPTSRRDR
jgi:hypothetical protein